MGTISHINGKAVADISHINSKAIADIDQVNGQDFVIESLSIYPDQLFFYSNGDPQTVNYTGVTASGTWSVSVSSDPDGIISSYTTGGTGNGNLYVYVNAATETDCTFAILQVSLGSLIEYLYIYLDGTSFPC